MRFDLDLHLKVKLRPKTKKLLVLKNFLQNHNCKDEQKTVLKSIRGPFSSLFEATSCGRYFSDYGSERAKV
jgi:hypothetical protein